MGIELLEDPLNFQRMCWPHLRLYDKQVEILYSLRDNDKTFVPAANQQGKDFITAMAVLWFFCSRSPCRIVTSSSGQSQLVSVLWGEIRRLIDTSKYDLPILAHELLIKQVDGVGKIEPRSYVRGIVTNVVENLQGHHLERGKGGKPRTLFVADEGSGIENDYYDATDTWAHRTLVIGNPLPCNNVFKTSVKRGDVKAPDGDYYYQKIIKIKAEDSPNVRLALSQIQKGLPVTHETLIPGVLDYKTYLKRRALWDPIRQCIGLDAEFYEGAEILLYPPDWLNECERIAKKLMYSDPVRNALTMGVDAAEGGDESVWTVIDRRGILEQISLLTKDTHDIPGRTIALMRDFRIEPEDVLFDSGGGGKQHADYLRAQGYNVRTVGFGEAVVAPDRDLALRYPEEAIDAKDKRYVYKNRRAQMYGILRNLMNPKLVEEGKQFAIPERFSELRRQLAPLPLMYDGEGRLYLPPKDKPSPGYKGITIKGLLGRSPDQADSLVLAVYGMVEKAEERIAGAI